MFYSLAELRRTKVYTLDNKTYNKIQDKCAEIIGDKMAKKMVEEMLEFKAIDLYNCTGIDFTKCFETM